MGGAKIAGRRHEGVTQNQLLVGPGIRHPMVMGRRNETNGEYSLVHAVGANVPSFILIDSASQEPSQSFASLVVVLLLSLSKRSRSARTRVHAATFNTPPIRLTHLMGVLWSHKRGAWDTARPAFAINCKSVEFIDERPFEASS